MDFPPRKADGITVLLEVVMCKLGALGVEGSGGREGGPVRLPGGDAAAVWEGRGRESGASRLPMLLVWGERGTEGPLRLLGEVLVIFEGEVKGREAGLEGT